MSCPISLCCPFQGHKSNISVATAVSATHLATCSDDGEIILWNMATCQIESRINSACSPRGEPGNRATARAGVGVKDCHTAPAALKQSAAKSNTLPQIEHRSLTAKTQKSEVSQNYVPEGKPLFITQSRVADLPPVKRRITAATYKSLAAKLLSRKRDVIPKAGASHQVLVIDYHT